MSGIEYVILAGSSLFSWSGAQSRYGSGLASCWRHKEHDYFNDFDFFAPEIAIFLWPAGASRGSEGSREVPRGPEGSRGERRGGRVWIFSQKGSNFQGNFQKRFFLRGVKFPKEFLETYVRANVKRRVERTL